MSSSAHQPRPVWSFRLVLVCLVALSASLPMAWISIAKILLFIFSLWHLLAGLVRNDSGPDLENLVISRIVLAILLAFSLSLMWTDADQKIALVSIVKHGKLLEILLLVSLIRTAQEARIGVMAFVIGQTFLLAGSWLLASGIHMPWVTAHGLGSEYVVFSSYLDQSIIFATTAAIVWHLRSEHLWRPWLGGLLAAAALINVLLLLEARTGYAVALTVLSLSVMWAMPRRLRFTALITTPVLVLFVLSVGSSQVHDRLSKMIHESQIYAIQGEIEDSSITGENSSGIRLNAWRRSVQAIEENPWFGHGVGSWTMTIKQLDGGFATRSFGENQVKNPHQEYLLWGVELGIGGTLLLLLLLAGIVRDTRQFKTSVARTTLCVVAALAVACMFNSTLYDGLIGDFFCIALGLLIALGLRSRPGTADQDMSAQGQLRMKVTT